MSNVWVPRLGSGFIWDLSVEVLRLSLFLFFFFIISFLFILYISKVNEIAFCFGCKIWNGLCNVSYFYYSFYISFVHNFLTFLCTVFVVCWRYSRVNIICYSVSIILCSCS